MSFSGYDTALQMRRLIEEVAATTINKLRPRPRYGAVQSIDSENSKCTVLFVGDTEAVEVNTGSLIPSHVGQRVKVEGLGVDKCVTALYGNEGITVHAASTGPFVKLARMFTGVRKEITLDGSTADQLKVQFASGGANTNAWVFRSDGTAYYNTDVEANQVQLGPPEAPSPTMVVCTSTTRPAHSAGLRIFETDTLRSGVSDGTYWTLTRPDAYCQVFRSTTQTITTNTWTAVSWPNAEHDGLTAWHAGNTGITVPWDGVYRIGGSFSVDNEAHPFRTEAELRIDGTAAWGTGAAHNNPSGYGSPSAFPLPTRLVGLTAGQVVGMGCYMICDVGDSHATHASGSWRPRILVEHVFTRAT